MHSGCSPFRTSEAPFWRRMCHRLEHHPPTVQSEADITIASLLTHDERIVSCRNGSLYFYVVTHSGKISSLYCPVTATVLECLVFSAFTMSKMGSNAEESP